MKLEDKIRTILREEEIQKRRGKIIKGVVLLIPLVAALFGLVSGVGLRAPGDQMFAGPPGAMKAAPPPGPSPVMTALLIFVIAYAIFLIIYFSTGFVDKIVRKRVR